MPRYVALLRAINVGGRTVKMERLRALFEALGFADVRTVIASGNVIFRRPGRGTAAAIEAAIEAHLQQGLGWPVPALVRTPREIAAVSEYQPFDVREVDAPGATVFVTFFKTPIGRAGKAAALAAADDVNAFAVKGRELYWLRRWRVDGAPMAGMQLERAAGAAGTTRNITTIRKLAALAAAP